MADNNTQNIEKKVDVPVRSQPNYLGIKYLLKTGNWEDGENYYKKKNEIRLEWEKERFRICTRCGEKKYRILFSGSNKNCKKCIYEKQKLSKQKKKTYRYIDGKSKTNFHCKSVVYHLKKLGILKNKPCEVCGNEKSEANHQDYNKPWVVQWLCKKHHLKWHKEYEPKRIK